jgi:hypothetical protein
MAAVFAHRLIISRRCRTCNARVPAKALFENLGRGADMLAAKPRVADQLFGFGLSVFGLRSSRFRVQGSGFRRGVRLQVLGFGVGLGIRAHWWPTAARHRVVSAELASVATHDWSAKA